jgi:hypothetical protein
MRNQKTTTHEGHRPEGECPTSRPAPAAPSCTLYLLDGRELTVAQPGRVLQDQVMANERGFVKVPTECGLRRIRVSAIVEIEERL